MNLNSLRITSSTTPVIPPHIEKNKNKITTSIQEKWNFVWKKITPNRVDPKIRKYVNYANKSQKLTQEEQEKHKKYLELKNKPFLNLTEEERKLLNELKIELSNLNKTRTKERKSKKTDTAYGQAPINSIKSNYAYLRKCLNKEDFFSEEERKEVELLCQHRKILLANLRLIMHNPFNRVGRIQNYVKSLANPQSKKVVHTKDGATFSIPGGCKGHYVTYEFKRMGDDYFFVIHNRGDGLGDKAIHGDLLFKHQGMPYAKTSVAIKTTKEALANPKFLRQLIKSTQSSSMEKPYHVIKTHLLYPPLSQPGIIIKSAKEMELDRKVRRGEPLSTQDKEMLLQDPSFHSLQVYGTCTESNLTGVEKLLASETTRTKIKYLTVENLVSEIQTKRFYLPSNKQYQKQVMEHSKVRLQQLKDKLEA